MTDMPIYRPFGSNDDEYEQLLVLRPGVPEDLREPVLGWLTSRLTVTGVGGSYVVHEVADKVRMLTQFDLGVTSDTYMPGENLTRRLRGLDEQILLRLIDALLYLNLEIADIITPMVEMLRLSRSQYTVGPRNGSFGLVDRIAQGEQASLDRLGDSAGAAGTLLQQSFSAAFGLQTNAGEAYKMAVKAVETAAHQTIEPNNTGATLGTMLGVMRNAPVKWTLPLDERADHAHGNEELLISIMQSIWDGQEDRHRDGKVELSESRAAFHAAVTLVGWFHDGLVQHGPQ
jgi:hypothetical protein